MTATQPTASLAQRSEPFLSYIEQWLSERPELQLEQVIQRAGGPDRVAIISVDLIVGFCHHGPLASPRIEKILPSVVRLLTRAHDLRVQNIVLAQDTHRSDAEEFESYPPHCIAGSEESQTAPALANLAFADSFTIIEKNCISSTIAPQWRAWEQDHRHISTWIIVGDCTDLCVYQAAMALMTRSMSEQLGHQVIVPIDCVQTYDMPVETALRLGAEPHDGDLLHSVFLHSMALNGVEVASRVV